MPKVTLDETHIHAHTATHLLQLQLFHLNIKIITHTSERERVTGSLSLLFRENMVRSSSGERVLTCLHNITNIKNI